MVPAGKHSTGLYRISRRDLLKAGTAGVTLVGLGGLAAYLFFTGREEVGQTVRPTATPTVYTSQPTVAPTAAPTPSPTPTPTPTQRIAIPGYSCELYRDQVVMDADIKNPYELTLPVKPCENYKMYPAYFDFNGTPIPQLYFEVSSEITAPIEGKILISRDSVIITNDSEIRATLATNQGKPIVENDQIVKRGDVIMYAGNPYQSLVRGRTKPEVPDTVNLVIQMSRVSKGFSPSNYFDLIKEASTYWASGSPKYYIKQK